MAPTKIENQEDVSINIALAMEIFKEHGDFIRTIIRFHVNNETEADDLFQDFFLFLVSKPIVEEVHNIRGFLYRMISDKARDASRRIKSYQGRLRRYAEHHKYIVEYCPEDTVIEVEETNKMFNLIWRNLPANEARAVTLRYRHNCDVPEVADKMGIKPRSVSRYVSVGLRKARHIFGINERQ